MAIASGMAMMIKSLGIDPEEIQKSVAGFGQIIVALKTSQDRTEKMMRAIYDEKFPDTDPAGIRVTTVSGNAGGGNSGAG